MANITTTSKSVQTRAQELAALMKFAKAHGYEGSTAKLDKVLAQWTAPRAKSDKPSKAAVENANLAAKVLRAMPEGEAVTGRWIADHVDGFPVGTNGTVSSQKVTAVMRLLVDAGKVSKAKVGKAMTYTLL